MHIHTQRDIYYLFLDGETTGPCTLEELQELWHTQRITPDTQYVQPGVWRSRPLNHILNEVIGYQKPAGEELVQPVIQEGTSNSLVTYFTVAVGLGFLFWLVHSTMKPTEDPSRALKAEVKESRARLNVINWNDYDWQDKTIVLNGKPPKGYKRKIIALKAGESRSLLLTDFTDQSRARFEPWRMPIEEVWIGDDKQGYNSVPPPTNQGPAIQAPLP